MALEFGNLYEIQFTSTFSSHWKFVCQNYILLDIENTMRMGSHPTNFYMSLLYFAFVPGYMKNLPKFSPVTSTKIKTLYICSFSLDRRLAYIHMFHTWSSSLTSSLLIIILERRVIIRARAKKISLEGLKVNYLTTARFRLEEWYGIGML